VTTCSDLAPFSFERFEEVRALGEGGMARVVLARDRELDRQVAIKWILPDLLEHVSAGKRFHNEARFLGAVNHPNVLQVYGCVQAPDGAVGLVMEYVRGRDLQRELARRWRRSTRRRSSTGT
jgi:serine/threonine protein kinase